MQPVQSFLSDWPNVQFSLPALLSIYEGILSQFSMDEVFSYLGLYELIRGIVEFHLKQSAAVGNTIQRDIDTYYTIIYDCCCKVESNGLGPIDQEQMPNRDVLLRFLHSVFENKTTYLSTVIKQVGTYSVGTDHPAITRLQDQIDNFIHSYESSSIDIPAVQYSDRYMYNIQPPNTSTSAASWMPVQQPVHNNTPRVNAQMNSSMVNNNIPNYPPVTAAPYLTVHASRAALNMQPSPLVQTLAMPQPPPHMTTYRSPATSLYATQAGSSPYAANSYTTTTAPYAPSSSIVSYPTHPYSTTPPPPSTNRFPPSVTNPYQQVSTQNYSVAPVATELYSHYTAPSSPAVPTQYHTTNNTTSLPTTSPYTSQQRDTSIPTTYANAPVYSSRPTAPAATYPSQPQHLQHNTYHSLPQQYAHQPPPSSQYPPQYPPSQLPQSQYAGYEHAGYAPTVSNNYPGPASNQHRYPPAHLQQQQQQQQQQQTPYNMHRNYRPNGRNYYMRNGIFDPVAFERLQPISRFLAHIRRQSMDVIFPQHLHDECMTCIYAAFKFHQVPVVHRVLMHTVSVLKESGLFYEGLKSLSKTKIRGVLSILKKAQIVMDYSGSPADMANIQLNSEIDGFGHMHEWHDRLVFAYCQENHLYIPEEYMKEVVWRVGRNNHGENMNMGTDEMTIATKVDAHEAMTRRMIEYLYEINHLHSCGHDSLGTGPDNAEYEGALDGYQH